MAIEVWESEEIKEKAVSLIKSFEGHTHLVDLLVDNRIKFFFVEKGSFDGKARMIRGATAEAASGTVFIIEINYAHWNEIGETERWALVDTQLCRCGGEYNDQDGTWKYSKDKPNIEAFTEVVERWGSYNEDIEKFVNASDVKNQIETMKVLSATSQEEFKGESKEESIVPEPSTNLFKSE